MLTLTRLARPPWTSASVSDLVGVLQADIFADDADRHLAFGVEQAVDDVVPARHVGLGRVVDAEGAQHLGVEPGRVILGGDGVDALRVERGDDRFLADVAEQGDLRALALGQLAVAAADDDLGLDAEAGQLAHAVLGRLGLQLAGGGDIGDERGVDRERVAARRLSLRNWRIASTKGSDSMSPTVPPTSHRTKSHSSSTSARMKSLIALVTCGMTWTVAPR